MNYDPASITDLPLFNNPTTSPAHHLRAAGTPTHYTDDTTNPVPTQPNPQTVDWDTVSHLRAQVSDELTNALQADATMDDDAQQALAQQHIIDIVKAHVDQETAVGGDAGKWTPTTRDRVCRTIFDSLFRLGRLQPLVDDKTIENIDMYGWDNVWVTRAGGKMNKLDPIYSSDAEMIADIAFLAQRGGEGGRSFTPSAPILDMDLPGNARLAAVHPPISPRPKAVVRIHRFVDVTLDQLVEQGTLSQDGADFLNAAVQAGLSIVVAGMPGAGKTTLTRALSNCIDPNEEIVTIEKERELHLDRMGDRHHIVTPLQYRPGQGERSQDGRRPGEVTLVDLLEESLRLNAERIIVGEVRGEEIDAMFQAMQAGVGSMSTLHASSPDDTIERMAGLTLRNLGTTDQYAYRQIAQHIDIIVQIQKYVDTSDDNRTVRRRVTHIAQVQPGEQIGNTVRPVTEDIFRLNRTTHTLTHHGLPTEDVRELLNLHGYDYNRYGGIH